MEISTVLERVGAQGFQKAFLSTQGIVFSESGQVFFQLERTVIQSAVKKKKPLGGGALTFVGLIRVVYVGVT